ncbi:fumarylacetoacetate hydrolase family protein [Paenibacillus rhizovicinus]|uniref:Fumarylacetoacetate hydrolase family protein n=1 Tax=Paenibacillus rhizovicinus TaxID=2704463 RepID=A0A6C0NYB7_9BACL|nr:fumarylacetoacetate hydrolase family protein [Paenibacillus rhizovicinus]QHW29472.1 fumarylacetoacetate hydrolase family protein [Paenibacillus rhizovicinus]
MRLATIVSGGREEAAIVTGAGLVPLRLVNEAAGTGWSEELLGLLSRGELDALESWSRGEGAPLLRRLEAIPASEAVYAPPYRHPRKIWGIGANYRAKAADMKVTPPDAEPICFLKPDTSLIGPGDAIVVPAGSGRVTAEAELGIVIGRTCKNVPEAEAERFVAGFVATLDMTDQDIHARNPRFLGRSKSFDTFFSFGPELVTLQDVRDSESLRVETVLNGQVVHGAFVADMIYPLRQVVAYFSRMATLLPGDVIMTGTPGSVEIREGDLAECRIGGFAGLANPVVREPEDALLAALS